MSDAAKESPIDAAAATVLGASGLRFELLGDDTNGDFHQAVVRGFNGPTVTEESIAAWHAGFASRRISAVWDDSIEDAATPVATASAWITELTLPGHRSIPSWAISTITVAPTHRRRGVARQLLEAELRTAAALDVPVAILTASEATIYERFGFAPATLRADWTIETAHAKWIGPTPAGRIQLLTHEQGIETGHAIVERMRLANPGQIQVDGFLWTRLFGFPGRVDPTQIRVARYDDVDGAPQGIVLYKVNREDAVHVEFLVAATDDAYAALWRYILEIDLVDKVKAELRPTDEPFRWQISDFRAATEDAVHDHLWVRILDVKAALEARQYSSPGTFELEITDPLGFANGCFLLAIDDAGHGIVRAVPDPDGFGGNQHLQLSVNELGATYLGATSFSTLVHAGRINEKTPGAAIAADSAFRSATVPWSSIWF